ncbi:hypothetical protein [Flavobacterium sp. LC2016-01]|uniref:hypothetical protein n=1 Tax=Flavobacterium sp. LC2016-01 TaxID=2675876 RepID=UPI0012BA5C28|nr:hypothetical protein [Flavobacterium sp. LC2016-01]MTH17510.1 hypothetical protein [Flavobacterium sp. LC2016-01]
MNKILFVSRYPNEIDLKDGMMQRIANVDAFFENVERTYLYISLTKNLSYSNKLLGNLNIIELNLFFHFFKICKLINKNTVIYVHSLWNYIWIALFSMKNKKLVIDLHGVVPEELEFYNRNILSWFFSIIERRLINTVSVMIYVNTTMKDYYLNKYKKLAKKENYVCPILTKNVFAQDNDFDIDAFKSEIGILENNIVFIYSGNIQKWQNFDMVIDSINKLNNVNYKFIILTNEINAVNKIILDRCNESKRKQILVFSVSPKELSKYYSISHYGYILRDDHILNRVAMPTKLIEYLYFGIVPIVKLIDIGDFNKFGYEYIFISDVSNDLCPVKSGKNTAIAEGLLKENYNIKELIL